MNATTTHAARLGRPGLAGARATGGIITCRPAGAPHMKCRRQPRAVVMRGAEEDSIVDSLEIEMSPEEIKKAEADALRAQERFAVVDLGVAECSGCGYVYDKNKGDPEYPVPAGMTFSQLPDDWTCPLCGNEKTGFANRTKTVAGFAANQKYGLGTNSMTSGEKNILIYGALIFFFALFLGGYAFN